MPPEPLYTVAELAEAWNCSRNHIYDLVNAGLLDTVDIGRRRPMTRIPQSAIQAFVHPDGLATVTPIQAAGKAA